MAEVTICSMLGCTEDPVLTTQIGKHEQRWCMQHIPENRQCKQLLDGGEKCGLPTLNPNDGICPECEHIMDNEREYREAAREASGKPEE